MAVIGRLDEQVDAIIISPLSQGRRPAEQQPPPPSAPGPEAGRPGAALDKPLTEHKRGPGGDELPVWLL